MSRFVATNRAARNWLVGLLLMLGVSQTACVQRRMTIRSNPPGAVVYVDDQEIGTTPVSTSFIYYGTRKVRLVKDGYETLTVLQPIPTPWYQYFPLDFVAENVVPNEIRDERILNYNMQPMMVVPPEELVARGEQLRRDANVPAVPAPPPTSFSLPPVTLPAPAEPVLPAPPPEIIPPGPRQPGYVPIP